MLRTLLTKYAGINILTRAETRQLCELKRSEGIKIGTDIGKLQVLRYNRQTLSPPKFKESAREFNFDQLDAKYPENPLLEQPHAKTQTPA